MDKEKIWQFEWGNIEEMQRLYGLTEEEATIMKSFMGI